MDNKEYVMEKLAFNYAGTLGRILARLGNKKAQMVIGEFKNLHSKALKRGLTTKSLGGFMKDMDRNPVVAKEFLKEQKALKAARKNPQVTEAAQDTAEGKQWGVFKPWTKTQKVLGAVGATGVIGAGAGAYYLSNKNKPQISEEEMMYQQMMQQQGYGQ